MSTPAFPGFEEPCRTAIAARTAYFPSLARMELLRENDGPSNREMFTLPKQNDLWYYKNVFI